MLPRQSLYSLNQWHFGTSWLKIISLNVYNFEEQKLIVFIGNPFEMRILNLRIIFFYLLQTFFFILVFFFCYFFSLRFGQISPLAFFRWLTVTSDRNAESCNRIPSNYCLPLLLSIAPRFWPSKPLAGCVWIADRGVESLLFQVSIDRR